MDAFEKWAYGVVGCLVVLFFIGFFALTAAMFIVQPTPPVSATSPDRTPRYGSTAERDTTEHMQFRFKGVEERLSRLEDKLDTLTARLTRQSPRNAEKLE
jgi:hypothetical protein